jgi:4,5-DOPA dioxygenase extradiol
MNDPQQRPTPRMPVVFVSHGAPTLALEPVAGADFRRLAAALPLPRAVLVVSAHWLDAPVTVGTRDSRSLLYDFAGFDDALYRVRYSAPPATELAADLSRRVAGLERADERPWDHGVWVPLVHMYPAADVPVLQLSLPYSWAPERLFRLGESLAGLRDEGTLVLASGGAVHNLGALDWTGRSAPPAWANDFEHWLRDRLRHGAVDDVVAFRERAPALRRAHPTDDHLLPLLVALGAAAPNGGDVTFPIEGFEYGSLSRLAVQIG